MDGETTQVREEATVYAVDAARLAWGEYNRAHDRTEGEGDIQASYSGDTIPTGKVRRPFPFNGSLWVSVGSTGLHNVQQATAYRLIPQQQFRGPPTTYAEKTRDGDEARADPNGFYHRMAVQFKKAAFCLCGPPAVFRAEAGPERPPVRAAPLQLDLF